MTAVRQPVAVVTGAAKTADRTALCEFVLTTCGGCDILVNNAAYNPIMPFAGPSTTPEVSDEP